MNSREQDVFSCYRFKRGALTCSSRISLKAEVQTAGGMQPTTELGSVMIANRHSHFCRDCLAIALADAPSNIIPNALA